MKNFDLFLLGMLALNFAALCTIYMSVNSDNASKIMAAYELGRKTVILEIVEK